MMTVLKRLLGTFSSLRLTIFCLAAALVLVFVGTLTVTQYGDYGVQERFFQSWFVWWTPPSGGFGYRVFSHDFTIPGIPYFPGGHLLGAVLLANLIASMIRRFSWAWRKAGIQLIHLGIIIMLLGGLASDLLSVTSNMRIRKGATKDFTEDSTRVELAVTDLTGGRGEHVTTVPGELLADGGAITHPLLPCQIVVRNYYRNAALQEISGSDSNAVPAANKGAGTWISVKPMPRVTRMDERDVAGAVLEILPRDDGKSLGTWLVSDIMAEPQPFELDGRLWSLQLRPVRYYKPYRLKLLDFTHEVYPGTNQPRNFASKVMLDDVEHHEHREVVISMNKPLRYRGDTYYQSRFDSDDGGTILQVVRNPGYQMPYIACVIVSLGLVFQFTFHLVGFIRRRIQPATES